MFYPHGGLNWVSLHNYFQGMGMCIPLKGITTTHSHVFVIVLLQENNISLVEMSFMDPLPHDDLKIFLYTGLLLKMSRMGVKIMINTYYLYHLAHQLSPLFPPYVHQSPHHLQCQQPHHPQHYPLHLQYQLHPPVDLLHPQ